MKGELRYQGDSEIGYYHKKINCEGKFFKRMREQLHQFFGFFDFEEMILVCNKKLLVNFINQRDLLQSRIQSSPYLFQQKSWQLLATGLVCRMWVYQTYIKRVLQFPWNTEETLVPIVPMLHATSVSVAEQICENGFATLSKLDSGFYGRGIYFTSFTEYAFLYLKSDPCYIVSLVCPGNVYPVIEGPNDEASLKGCAIKVGYTAHYVNVTLSGLPSPIEDEFYDELVVNQESQITPALILKLNPQTVSEKCMKYLGKLKITPLRTSLDFSKSDGVPTSNGDSFSGCERSFVEEWIHLTQDEEMLGLISQLPKGDDMDVES
eukprot:TRINITY_DN9632_c0_g1_i7.p1 TRINITY_DN9632_c0_g1~~TRINITY_DN9632_c0_g1_i7.p1  ORF type:complete len:321 (-),score=61.73 TRINITY_DN9632_c0_g1_i7:230-1192(-)